MMPFKAVVRLRSIGVLELSDKGVGIKESFMTDNQEFAKELDVIFQATNTHHGCYHDLISNLLGSLGLSPASMEVVSYKEGKFPGSPPEGSIS